MNIRDLVRPQVREIAPYTLTERTEPIKLDQNESPYDLPREIKEHLVRKLVERPWNRYPQFEQSRIRGAFAETYGLEPEQILVGNGSNELLLAVMQTFVDSEATVIVARPSFSLYEHYARVLAARIIGVPVDLPSGRLPVDGMIDAARNAAGRAVIFLCSPNNPTGSQIGGSDLERLLETGAVVVLDRAYGEFCSDEIPHLVDRLVVLSTLSKAMGLAGLRVGWLASTAATVREIRKVKLPYNLNLASEEIAAAALGARDQILSIVETITEERERVSHGLVSIGVEVFPSSANFLLFRVGNARDVFDSLLSLGILVRDVSKAPGLNNCLRVSVGSPEENDRFLEAMGRIGARVPEVEEVAS